MSRGSNCGCPTPVVRSRALMTASRPRARQPRRTKESLPIVIDDAGTQCRPFLTVIKDEDRFAACNALAEKIGPLDDPKHAAKFLREVIGHEVNEVFGVMTLDQYCRLKGLTETGRGEPASVMAPMQATLRAAINSGGEYAVLFHVHPSGMKAEPSDADKETTEDFAEAFETIGMPLIDHIIVGGDKKRTSYYSFAEDDAL